MSLSTTPAEAAAAAKLASYTLAALPTSSRNDALTTIHSALQAHRAAILAANARDMATATTLASDGELSSSLVARLDLAKPGKFDDMLAGILDVRDLEDPLGVVSLRTKLDDGLVLERVACPIGVLLVIFEARPEVIANIASLAIKSGNAAILKGGKESTETFVAIATVIADALSSTAVPNAAIQLVTTREAISSLLSLDRHIDLVIPRGGAELVRHIKSNTRIPVLGHADGICAIYLAPDADLTTTPKLIIDSKTGYPAACNAVETLLVHADALTTDAFSRTILALVENGVSLKCDPASLAAATAIISSGLLSPSTPEDYDTEFLSLTLAIKTVPSLDVAIAHINAHGSHHTDAILTTTSTDAESFMARVDSAGVYWNASTRMADGMRYGFGTEVGISTNKIHSRGPVGLEGLTIYKYKLRGGGHVTGDYGASEGKKRFKHERMALGPVDM